MDFLRSLTISASGLKAQAGRMRVIAENIANADSTATRPGQEPYRRKVPTFKSELDRDLDVKTVELGRIRRDQSAFKVKYEPNNPAADAQGNIRLPNVDSLIEQMDMKEAQRSYEANLGVITATRKMASQTLGILRA
jgi:flagellar basal-body rod protein FlgC